ncbi:hypothetical protein ACYPKM_00270 [Pseudomonas aeruginosa]
MLEIENPHEPDDQAVVHEVRRRNLKALMEHEYGKEKHGSITRLAKRLEKQQDYISRCLFPKGHPARKNIGESFARQIETSFGLARHALDTLIAFGDTSISSTELDAARRVIEAAQSLWPSLSLEDKKLMASRLIGNLEHRVELFELVLLLLGTTERSELSGEKIAALATLIRN